MNKHESRLLEWIERDQEKLIALASALVSAKSPNPPGETEAVARLIQGALDDEGIPYKRLEPMDGRPNIVASFDCATPGNRLVLNGHMDVLPVVEGEDWTHGPWSGAVADGRIWGRGATNMKCGLAVAVFVFIYLYRMRETLTGSLTFSAVSEEIVLGDMGTSYLMEHAPEVLGDACLIAEPSGLRTIRFGEKGPMRLRFNISAAGGHGAFTHKGQGAIKIASRLIADLDELQSLQPDAPDNVRSLLDDASAHIDETQGIGASGIAQKVTITIATIDGGIAKNMIPSKCNFVADIRLPVGMHSKDFLTPLDEIVKRYSGVTVELMDVNEPAWCNPVGAIPTLIREVVSELAEFTPEPTVSLGCTDARLWRYRGIPSYNYGPPPTGMGAVDENVKIEDLVHVMRTHTLTACRYLVRSASE